MQSSSRISSLLLFTLLALCAAYAADPNTHGVHLKRQNTAFGTGDSSSVVVSSSAEESSIESSSESPSEITSEAASTSIPSSTPAETSRAAITSDEPPSASPASSTPASTPQSTAEEQSQNDAPTPTSERTVPSSTSVPDDPQQSQQSQQSQEPADPEGRTDIITTTASGSDTEGAGVTIRTTVLTVDGRTFESLITSRTADPTEPSSTDSPSLNGQEGEPGSSGLSSSQKNIIIGTVVGIGGAILLGALAVVAWRIWGKRKQNMHDDDAYDPNNIRKAPSSSGSVGSPFKSTLDQYHQPTPVNTASNF